MSDRETDFLLLLVDFTTRIKTAVAFESVENGGYSQGYIDALIKCQELYLDFFEYC